MTASVGTISRRITDQFLTTRPENYNPKGYRGYVYEQGGRWVNYAVWSLWANCLANARLTGDTDVEKRLIALFEPFYGPKASALPKFKHVDFTIVGALPLEIARLTGDARAKALGLKYADMQWEEPKPSDPPPQLLTSADVGIASFGMKPTHVFGKPSPTLLAPVLAQFKPEEIAVVGDRLYTDKAIADNAGVDFVCVLSGETTPEDLKRYKGTPPAIVVETFNKVESRKEKGEGADGENI